MKYVGLTEKQAQRLSDAGFTVKMYSGAAPGQIKFMTMVDDWVADIVRRKELHDYAGMDIIDVVIRMKP